MINSFYKKTFACLNRDCSQFYVQKDVEKRVVDYNLKAKDGSILGKNECEDYFNNNFACESCKKTYCMICRDSPFHFDMSCKTNKLLRNCERCRFDNVIITDDKKGPSFTCCNNPECVEKYKYCCKKQISCGHRCPGTNLDSQCMSCIDSSCSKYVNYYSQNSQTECFCLETLGSAPIIKLECNHIFHYKCILDKIKSRWNGAKITFKYLNCTTCDKQIRSSSVPELDKIIKEHVLLYDQIAAKIPERLRLERLADDPQLIEKGGRFYGNQIEFGLYKLLYLECYRCTQPFFGGLNSCVQNEEDLIKEEMICISCKYLDRGSDLSLVCNVHDPKYFEYKCKFCCSRSVYFCGGRTHFCQPCHDKQRRRIDMDKIPKDELPKCPGRDLCPLRVNHPPNGEEYAFECVQCKSEMLNEIDVGRM